ncbi:nucleoid-associated protein [Peptostreptococcus sp. D1]|uniref:nucleoid-associated protein n=1 Tax=Peptostreptococcus sp. D1 TaxID=72304 RepID=UPI0008E5FE11|nr:nucleoid-associated protein [Peptostreptococcus sp. D1]SFE89750.1 hypothetical protein SAMN02910278_01996 [Peptostreptococcus sp. D1]
MIINKEIIHVLDKNADFPILNDIENRISPETDAFYQKVIRRILRDLDLRKAVFKNYNENKIRTYCDQIIYDNSSFIGSSKEIARLMFDSMKVNSELDSCDLAIILFTHKDQKYVAIIKLDYKKLYTHEIGYDNDNKATSIKMITNDIGIQDSQKIIHSAIVGVSGVNDEWHLQILDKVAEKQETDSSFTSEFLKAKKIFDERYQTKTFYETMNNLISNSYPSEIKRAEDIRSILNYCLKEENNINVEKFLDECIDDDYRKQLFKMSIKEKGIEDEFIIDKSYVEKRLKQRKVKTNTGFSIKGFSEYFEDAMKFSIKQNADGTADLIIKNIEFIE